MVLVAPWRKFVQLVALKLLEFCMENCDDQYTPSQYVDVCHGEMVREKSFSPGKKVALYCSCFHVESLPVFLLRVDS